MAHSMALIIRLYILQAERRYLIYRLNWCLWGTLKSLEKCYITAKDYYKILQAKKKVDAHSL